MSSLLTNDVLVKDVYTNSFKNRTTVLYRISSFLDNLNFTNLSYVYLRFIKSNGVKVDYIDFRGRCSEQEYNSIVKIENKIEFNLINNILNNNNIVKYWENKIEDEVNEIYTLNILTYFPFYRFDYPLYINDKYKEDTTINIDYRYENELRNKIEITSNLKDIINWILNLYLDLKVDTVSNGIGAIKSKEYAIINDLNRILTEILSYKYKHSCSFCVGKRDSGISRLSINNSESSNFDLVYPSIFGMSAGELALLCLFFELIRQADRLNLSKDNVSGIVLIDEIDKHLHIRLQKEVLPKLLKIFPNLQFIISSHSPFFSLGLQEYDNLNYKIFDLNNNGIECKCENTSVIKDFYTSIISSTSSFTELYNKIGRCIKINKTLVISEGQSDWKHIEAARKHLDVNLDDVEFYHLDKTLGDSELKKLLELFCKCNPFGNIIGMFDRDKSEIIIDKDNQKRNLMEKGYYSLGENVYAFAIPLVNRDLYKEKISIEHYYRIESLKKEDTNGRRLFLGSEFYPITGIGINNNYICTLGDKLKNKHEVNGIIDSNVYLKEDEKGENPKALSKERFAELILNNESFSSDIDFSNFKNIFDIIQSILNEIHSN